MDEQESSPLLNTRNNTGRCSIQTHQANGFEISGNRDIQNCQKKIEKNYLAFHKIVGWEPFFHLYQEKSWHKCVNIAYPVFVVATIIVGYTIQVAACFCRFVAFTGVRKENGSCYDDIVSRYIIVNILHFSGFAYAFYTHRFKDTEYTKAFIEEVYMFIRRSPMDNGRKNIEKYCSLITAGSVLWIVLRVVCDIIHVATQNKHLTFSFLDMHNHSSTNCGHSSEPGEGFADESWHNFLLFILLASAFYLNVVYAAAVSGYLTLCHLLIFQIKAIQITLDEGQQASCRLHKVVKTCERLRENLGKLNNNTGPVISLIIVICICTTALGVYSIYEWLKYDSKEPKFKDCLTQAEIILMLVSHVVTVLLWVMLIVVPLTMAALLSSECTKLRMMGLNIRANTIGDYEHNHAGNSNELQQPEVRRMKIDSFLLYMSALKISAKLFLSPVRGGLIVVIVISFPVFLLVLTQLGVFD